jgi:ribosomal protein L22
MGQKTNPVGLRLQINRTWDSRWFAEGQDYGRLLLEDLKIRKHIMKILPQAAIANAENNHSLDVDRLVVAEAFVGRSFKLKRFHARARGRGAAVVKTWSNITVVVRERADQEEKA